MTVAIDASKGRDEIVTPGHVFPLVARDGGVLVRTGHTEAAVDVARLAGLNPSGVICEIMNEDGTMARMDDLVAFAQLHNLKIGTIRDLIAHRRRHDHDVEKIGQTVFVSHYGGEWTVLTYRNKAVGSETLALVKGKIVPARPTLVRMHTLNIFDDGLGEISDRFGLTQSAMRTIAEEGSGVVVIINRPSIDALSRDAKVRSRGNGAEEISELRDYGIGAQILAELNVHDMILLTNSHQTLVALDGYGLNIVGERPIKPITSESS